MLLALRERVALRFSPAAEPRQDRLRHATWIGLDGTTLRVAIAIGAGLIAFFLLLSIQIYCFVETDEWRPRERSRYPVLLSLVGAIGVGHMVSARRKRTIR